MAATISQSQLSCFSALNRSVRLQRLSFPSPSLRSKEVPFKVEVIDLERTSKSYPDIEEDVAGNLGSSEPIQENGVIQQKRAAKIHDFCFGIPYGGLVLSGGLLGFVFSRNLATLSAGVLFGGALLALSTFSLKIWRQGKSSLPFILGQAALSAALLWKNFQSFSLTKKVFPTGFYAAISAAMLCFYSYVLISGGNPPPKKLKSSPSFAS
ncbi:protein fatty acid export 1 [Quercus suber]|uniref:Protein fatty acid export 1 n=1 Tax=Quercus suber TaxID=58331 RepID=A0AAW0L2F9_QUESU